MNGPMGRRSDVIAAIIAETARLMTYAFPATATTYKRRKCFDQEDVRYQFVNSPFRHLVSDPNQRAARTTCGPLIRPRSFTD